MKDELTLTNMNKMCIIPHCDILIRNEQLYIPTIQSNTIHIAFVGRFNEYKGGRLFLDLIYNLLTYKDYKIEYHIFGDHTQSENDYNLKKYVHFHGSYKDTRLIQDLYDNNIHILTSFSLLEETYCYALSLLINSGLPIAYLNRGASMTRLSCNYPRLFPIENTLYSTIESAIIKTIEYVIDNQGRCDIITLSNEIKITEEYKNLYLPE
jgi:glycosyltransferase involved in cell wall biosynthesis